MKKNLNVVINISYLVMKKKKKNLNLVINISLLPEVFASTLCCSVICVLLVFLVQKRL